MNDLDRILDDCLSLLASGAATLDECLARHPEQAAQLKPLLQTAIGMESGLRVRPSSAYTSHSRAQLMAHMHVHPRRRISPFFEMQRVVISLVAVAIASLATGTAFAQAALPGQALYPWKLSSEHIWRAVSSDQVAVDLSLAHRRVDEMRTLVADPDQARETRAMDGYREVLARLKSESDAQNGDAILKSLKSHQEQLFNAGVSVPELDDYLSGPPGSANPDIRPAVKPPVFPTTTPDPNFTPAALITPRHP
jgi:hypothetical protein